MAIRLRHDFGPHVEYDITREFLIVLYKIRVLNFETYVDASKAALHKWSRVKVPGIYANTKINAR